MRNKNIDEQTSTMATETNRLPLEVEGLELLSDEGLSELRQWVERETLRRRALVETRNESAATSPGRLSAIELADFLSGQAQGDPNLSCGPAGRR
jgi:hypothetical protein